MGLPLWSAPLPEEPAHGLIMRLAEVNGYPKIQSVLDETGLSTAALHRGEELDALAALVRQPVEAIAADSFHMESEGNVSIRGHRLNFKLDYALQFRRACPACLRESAHHRFIWDLSFVTTCPRHGLKLEGTCACGSGRTLGWLDPRVYRGRCCRTGDLRTVDGEAGEPDIVAMDAYFAGRLGVGARIEIAALDELALCDVVETLDRVGSLKIGGYIARWQTSRRARKLGAPAMAMGYRIIRDGRLQETLDAVYEGFLADPKHRPPSLTVAYGWFYHWYNSKGNSRFSKYLTEEIYRHAAKRFRIDRKAMRNKSVIVSAETNALMDAFDRGRTTLSDAARRCGCHLTTLRRLAVSLRLMREEKLLGRVVLLEDADVKLLAFVVKRTILRRWAADLMQVRPRFIDRLVEERLVVPILSDTGRKGERQRLFLVDDLQDIVALFEDNCSPAPIKGRSVSVMRSLGPYSLKRIIEEIRAGRLSPHITDAAAQGLARFRFRRADLRDCRNGADDASVREDETQPAIGWLRTKIASLQARSDLKAYQRVRRRPNGDPKRVARTVPPKPRGRPKGSKGSGGPALTPSPDGASARS